MCYLIHCGINFSTYMRIWQPPNIAVIIKPRPCKLGRLWKTATVKIVNDIIVLDND